MSSNHKIAVAMLAGRRAGKRRPAALVRAGFGLSTLGMALIVPIVPRADTGWALAIPLVITGAGLGLLVSQLNNYTLAPVPEERSAEAAGVNSAAGSYVATMITALMFGFLMIVSAAPSTSALRRV